MVSSGLRIDCLKQRCQGYGTAVDITDGNGARMLALSSLRHKSNHHFVDDKGNSGV